MLKRNDCAFYRGEKNRFCNILMYDECPVRCSFYKTPEQLHEGRKKAVEKIKTLPSVQQTYINNKYYTMKKIRQKYSVTEDHVDRAIKKVNKVASKMVLDEKSKAEKLLEHLGIHIV